MMTYREKIKHAEVAAAQLMDNKPLQAVRQELTDKDLYEADVDKIIVSARNIIGEKLKPQIRKKLLAKETITGAPEFTEVDPETLDKLVKQEIKAIGVEQRRKVNKMLKEGSSNEKIMSNVLLDFYPAENVMHQINTYEQVSKENGAGGRMLKIVGGGLMMLVGIGITVASMNSNSGGRIMYGLVIVGLVTMISGFATKENPYD